MSPSVNFRLRNVIVCYRCLKDTKVKFEVDPNVAPKYCKARTVPYTIKEELDKEIDRLESEDIITPIINSK